MDDEEKLVLVMDGQEGYLKAEEPEQGSTVRYKSVEIDREYS